MNEIRIMAVGIGGGVGALLRYFIQFVLGPSAFPLGTLIINIIGSFLLGIITGYFMNQNRGKILHLALGTGFCGGFTTMSTFSSEAVKLMQHSIILGCIYIVSTLIFGLFACFIGLSLFRNRSGEGK